MRIAVIGAGVIGLCTAYYLQRKGYDVTVIDRNDITDGCSFGNMGYISPSHFIPLATPGIISQGLKWMMSSSSPFYIKPRMDIDLLRWGIKFWNKANASNVESSAPHLNNLLQLSRQQMNELKRDLPTGFDMIEKGCWMLYKSARTADHEKHLAEQAQGFGLKTIQCSSAEVQDREPQVEVNVAGGVLYLDDCHINPSQFMLALYQSLKQAGVQFLLHRTVTGFEKKGKQITAIVTDATKIETDECVVANGSWMGKISRQLGISLLMQPGKGYSVLYEGLTKNLQYPSILVDDRTATAPIGSRLRIGGTMELSGHSDNLLPKRVQALYTAFRKYYPTVNIQAPELHKAWFGYRPVTPDGMPYIGRHPQYDNLLFAGGHAMLGVSAAAGTGLLIEELVSRSASTIPLSAFRPERFS